MDGTEIITILASGISGALSAVGSIVGAILTSVFLRHDTATEESEKIKAGQFESVVEDLLSRGKMTLTELYKAKNFLEIAKIADGNNAQKAKIFAEKSYDFDWFLRFYEAAGNISDEQMQDIWARILSGEINCPGSFSLRTIDVLRNMSKNDAELFNKICSYVIDVESDAFLPNYETYLEKSGITYSEIMRLGEIGLINSNGFLSLKITVPPEGRMVFHNSRLLISAKSATDDNVDIRVK